jgi:hypothetical protein
LGFFPFCNQENTQVIARKILEKFEEFKATDARMSHIYIAQSFATYPSDGENTEELLQAIASSDT